MWGLEGKVALVPGAGRGIGRAFALALGSEGARMVLNDVDRAPADQTADEVRQRGGEAAAIAGSVREHVSKFIVADDVVLEDRSAEIVRLAVEGPEAPAILAVATGTTAPPTTDAASS